VQIKIVSWQKSDRAAMVASKIGACICKVLNFNLPVGNTATFLYHFGLSCLIFLSFFKFREHFLSFSKTFAADI
jgi:hypothetical protein